MAAMNSSVKILNLPMHGDFRGSLIAVESGHEVEFKVQRVYYIYGVKAGSSRGFHAHRELKQLLVAVSGSVNIRCEDSSATQEFQLDSPEKALLIDGLVWREMYNFSEDCVLLALASDFYSEDDYVRNYGDFKKMLKELQPKASNFAA